MMILTFLMSQTQAESQSMSTNIQWGCQAQFKQGIAQRMNRRYQPDRLTDFLETVRQAPVQPVILRALPCELGDRRAVRDPVGADIPGQIKRGTGAATPRF